MFTDKFYLKSIYRFKSFRNNHPLTMTLTDYDYFVIYVNSGKLEAKVNNEKHILKSDDFAIFKKDDNFFYRCYKDTQCDIFTLHFELKYDLNLLNLSKGLYHALSKDVFCQLCTLYDEFIFRKPNFNTALSALLLNLLCTLSRSTEKTNTYTEMVFLLAKEIHENFLTGNFDVNKYALEAGVSKDRFSVIFREHFGYAPYKYSLMLKMKEAENLLLNSNMTLSEISEYLGFSSPLYFSSVCKKQLGKSPTEIRKRI